MKMKNSPDKETAIQKANRLAAKEMQDLQVIANQERKKKQQVTKPKKQVALEA